MGTNLVHNEYLDTLFTCGFKSYINVYTRTPLNPMHACLDHIFVKNKKWIDKFEAGVIQTTITDHNSMVLAIPIFKHINQAFIIQPEIINFKILGNNFKMIGLWTDFYNSDNINKSCDIFYDKLKKSYFLWS